MIVYTVAAGKAWGQRWAWHVVDIQNERRGLPHLLFTFCLPFFLLSDTAFIPIQMALITRQKAKINITSKMIDNFLHLNEVK